MRHERYDLRKANEHAIRRERRTRTQYRNVGQLVRALCPRWVGRHK